MQKPSDEPLGGAELIAAAGSQADALKTITRHHEAFLADPAVQSGPAPHS